MALTPRQKECLAFLQTYLKAHGIAPSYNEIAIAIGLRAKSGVRREIIALEAAGLLRRIPSFKHAIELIHTRDNHTPDCNCSGCDNRHYRARLRLIHAIQVPAPIALTNKFVGLRPLGHLERLDWAHSDNSRVRRKPLFSHSKTHQTAQNQTAARAV